MNVRPLGQFSFLDHASQFLSNPTSDKIAQNQNIETQESNDKPSQAGESTIENRVNDISVAALCSQEPILAIIMESESISSMDESEHIIVKQEPGLELDHFPSTKKVFDIKKMKEGLPLINPHFDINNEIGVENCLPCVISCHNWIITGSEKPEEVNPQARPQFEHMTPINSNTCLLQDPHIEKLNTPKEIIELDEEKTKSFICLTNDLPLTFLTVKLAKLKEKITSSTIPWQQYEKSGETFKTGILFLPYRSDETRAHFLNFYYYKSNTTDRYSLYILDPQSAKHYEFKSFIKTWEKYYSQDIKIWYGQNKINYDCNKTVKQIFEVSIKKEKENSQFPATPSQASSSASTQLETEKTLKRVRPLNKSKTSVFSKKPKVFESDSKQTNHSISGQNKDNSWAHMMTRIILQQTPFEYESLSSILNSRPSNLENEFSACLNNNTLEMPNQNLGNKKKENIPVLENDSDLKQTLNNTISTAQKFNHLENKQIELKDSRNEGSINQTGVIVPSVPAHYNQQLVFNSSYPDASLRVQVSINNYANSLAKQGRLQEAEVEFKKALALTGGQQHLSTVCGYAITLRLQGRVQEAEAEFKKALALPGGQQDLSTVSGYADILRLQVRLQEAEVEYKRALALPGGQQDLSILSGYANALRLQGRVQEAEAEYKKALALPGGQQDLSTVSGYADTLRLQVRLQEAEVEYKRALALPGGQQHLSILSGYADTLHKQGKLQGREAESKKALALSKGPQDLLSVRDNANTLRLQVRLQEAEVEFKKALALPGGQQHLSTVCGYADTLRLQVRLQEAEAEFKKALALPGGQQDLFTESGYATTLGLQGRLQEAEAEFKKALALPGGQQDLFTVCGYATTLGTQGRLQEAKVEFKKALALPGGQQHLSAVSGYATTLGLQGRLQEAEAEFKKALALPGGQQHLSTVSGYADTLRLQGRLQEAEAEFKKALALPGGQQHLSTVSGYADILRLQGRLQEAEAEFKKALALPGGQQHLSTVSGYVTTLRLQDRLQEAEAEFKKAFALLGAAISLHLK